MYNPAAPNQPPPQNGQFAPPYNQEMMRMNPGQMPLIPMGIRQLETLNAVFIKQQFEKWEAFLGFETPNSYHVYAADVNGQLIQNVPPIFKCKEKSSCFQRVCCPGDARGFEMKVCQFNGQVDEKGKAKAVQTIHFNQQYQVTLCCIGRPQMQISTVQGEAKTSIGKIFHPWLCTEIGVDIYDQENVPKYSVRGSACQLGILCRGCCYRACQEVKFSLNNYKDKAPLQPFLKEYSGCGKSMTDCDYFRILFPDGSTCEEKALIVAAAIFVDYRYFEESPTGDQNQATNYLL